MSSDGPEEPWVTGPEAAEVNDRVTLTCSAPSVPPANFTWTFNGSATPVTTATYVIDKVAFKDTGTYACEAHNAVTGGRRQSKHFLSVKGEARQAVGMAPCLMALWLQRRGRWRKASQTEPSPGSSSPSCSPWAEPSASSSTADRKFRELRVGGA